MSISDTTMNSILAVDFGSVYTRVVLIDIVEGEYRLVARGESRTTDGYPANDILVGFQRVVQNLSQSIGRRFLAHDGSVITPEKQDRTGVDLFAVTASIGRPLRAVIVGLVPEVSIASAIRAASGTYIDIAAVVSLDDGRSEQDRLNAILLNMPDVIILTGGTEKGAAEVVLELAQLVKMAVLLIDRVQRPSVVYSGNSALQGKISAVFMGEGNETINLLIAENVRPALDNEDLDSAQLQLGRAFDRYKEVRSRSFAQLGSMSQTGVLPTGQSYTFIADYLGKVENKRVALLDIGSSSSTLSVSDGQQVISSIRTDIGLGHSAPALLESAGEQRIKAWVPFQLSTDDLQNYVMNKALRPAGVPATLFELYIEHALLRAGAGALMALANPEWEDHSPTLDLLISAGSALTGTGHPAYDALLLLDCVQPNGVTVLQADPYGLIAAMGAIALQSPEAVIQLLGSSNLTPLGTCITINGRIRPEKPALQVKVSFEGGEIIEESIMGGNLWVLSLGTYEIANVKINCASDTSVNGKRSVELKVSGGTVGLIIDARGRPLPLAESLADRAAQLTGWVAQMTNDPLQIIDPRWLEESETQAPATAQSEKSMAQVAKRARKKAKAQKQRGRGKKQEAAPLPDDDLFDDLDTQASEDDELDELRNVLS